MAREILASHSPLVRPLTAKAITARLAPQWRRCDSAIRQQVRAIRLAAELAEPVGGD